MVRDMARAKTGAHSAAVENRFVQAFVAKKWTFLLIVMAFLLGRAMILEQLSPFALAFIAVIYFTRRDILHWVGIAAFAGSLLSLHSNTGYLVTEIIVFLLIQKRLRSLNVQI